MMSDIKNKLTIVDQDKKEYVVPCIDVHLIINKKLENVNALIDAIYVSFLKEFENDFTFCEYAGKRKKITPVQKEKFREWLKDKKQLKKALLGYDLNSAKSLSSAPAAPCFSFSYDATYGRNVVRLRLSFPIDYDPHLIKQFITKVLKNCPVEYGYGGYALLFEDDFAYNKSWTSHYAKILKSYPGLVFSEGNAFSEMVVDHKKIPVVNWLTILGENFIDVLGGKNRIKADLSNHFEFSELENALCIFAGDSPELGEKNASSLPLYQEIGRFLKPASITHQMIEETGVAGMDDEEDTKWHMRFFD